LIAAVRAWGKERQRRSRKWEWRWENDGQERGFGLQANGYLYHADNGWEI